MNDVCSWQENERIALRNRARRLAEIFQAAKNRSGGVLRVRDGSSPCFHTKTRHAGFAQGLQWVGENGYEAVFAENRRNDGLDKENETDLMDRAVAAWETDMLPVREAMIEALQEGDMEALRGLRALIPELLQEVLEDPTLADVLAEGIGGEVAKGVGITRRRGDAGGDKALMNGVWKEGLHPRGGKGRFVESAVKANIQRGRNAIRRVYSEEIDVPAAMQREDVGDIDFLWDHNGMGIRHIITRREEQDVKRPDLNKLGVYELLDELPKVIARGKATLAGDILEIEHEGSRVLLAKRRGKSKNVWLMSGYEINPDSRRKRRSR